MDLIKEALDSEETFVGISRYVADKLDCKFGEKWTVIVGVKKQFDLRVPDLDGKWCLELIVDRIKVVIYHSDKYDFYLPD